MHVAIGQPVGILFAVWAHGTNGVRGGLRRELLLGAGRSDGGEAGE